MNQLLLLKKKGWKNVDILIKEKGTTKIIEFIPNKNINNSYSDLNIDFTTVKVISESESEVVLYSSNYSTPILLPGQELLVMKGNQQEVDIVIKRKS